jgi:hypothetical protein
MTSARLKKILPWVWFCASLAALFALMQWRMDYLLNSDMGSELLLAKLLSQENTILSQNWYYATELHVWYSQLIYAPLFKLFSDWHTVRMIGSFILFAVLLLSYYYLCRALRLTKWYLWTAPVLVLPMSTLYFTFMVYGTHYTFNAASAFFVLGMILQYGGSQTKLRRNLLLCAIGVLSFLTGMNGLRYLMVFYAPLVIAAIVLLILHRDTLQADGKWKLRGNRWVSYFTVAVIACLFATGGYLVNTLILTRDYSFVQYDYIHFVPISLDTLEQLINGWLDAFGYSSIGDFLSLHSLQNLICLGITVLIFLSIRQAFKHPERYPEERRLVTFLFAAALIVFAGLYLTTNAPYAARYYLPVTVFALPVVTIYLHQLPWKPRWRNVCCGLMVTAVAFNAAMAYHVLWQQDDTGELKAITQLLRQEDYHEGYASFWHANVVTELADGEIDVRCWGNNDLEDFSGVEMVNPWLQVITHETTTPEGAVFLLLTSHENEVIGQALRLDEQKILYRTDAYVLYGYDSYTAMRESLQTGATPQE